MLREPDVRERFRTLGVTPLSGTPEDLGNYLKFEVARWAKLIADTGIKLEGASTTVSGRRASPLSRSA